MKARVVFQATGRLRQAGQQDFQKEFDIVLKAFRSFPVSATLVGSTSCCPKDRCDNEQNRI